MNRIHILVRLLSGWNITAIQYGYLKSCEAWDINFHGGRKAFFAYVKCIFRIIFNVKLNAEKLKKRIANDIRDLYGFSPNDCLNVIDESKFFIK